MNRKFLVVLILCCAGAAHAQDPGLSLSIGVRAWQTDWTTFSYYAPPPANENVALTQVSADGKLALMPLLSARYGKFLGSLSGFPSTSFSFDDGSRGEREEFDANVGYYVLPGLAVTIGYKKVSQSGDAGRYRPSGPVLGLSGNAPLDGPWSLYGSLGVGWLKTPSGDKIDFEADYRLAEVGLGYTLNTNRWLSAWTFTAGYRMQVMNSKDAFPDDNPTQDGLDTTKGFTVGVIATF